MSKAEERALEAYPKETMDITGFVVDVGHPQYMRDLYIEGYHQAEKDLTDKAKVSSGWDGFYYGQGYKQAEKNLELTWEDMMAIDDLLDELLPPKRSSDELVLKGYYEEVLKRFKERSRTWHH